MLRFISLALNLTLTVLLAWCSAASARTPLEVAISSSGDYLHADGYGVLVWYKDNCLAVMPAHVVARDAEELPMAEITAWFDNSVGSISFADADQEKDIYVGFVDPASALYNLCDQSENIADFNKDFVTSLKNMLEKDFHRLQMHLTPRSIELIAASPKTFNEAKRGQPITYVLAPCETGDECAIPRKGFSGSMISMYRQRGERIWLGLHQRRCDETCQTKSDAWQAISVMQIYEFMASPNSPLNSEDMGSAIIPTTDPGDEFKKASFDWDIAFSQFLGKLQVMRFPQAGDGTCEPRCSIWRLRSFYGNELNPGALEGFKSRFEDLGPTGSILVGATTNFSIPFDQAAFVDVIATGKRLNQIIDSTQSPPPNLSHGELMGFVVNGSPQTWINFYEQVPVEYVSYVHSVRNLFDKYCTEFKAAAKQRRVSSVVEYYGDLASYEDPCLKSIDWDNMVDGDASFALSKLSEGF